MIGGRGEIIKKRGLKKHHMVYNVLYGINPHKIMKTIYTVNPRTPEPRIMEADGE